MNKSEVNKEIIRIEQETRSYLAQLTNVENNKSDWETKKEDLFDRINNEKSQNFEKEKEFNDLSKQYELEKEKEVVLQSDKLDNM